MWNRDAHRAASPGEPVDRRVRGKAADDVIDDAVTSLRRRLAEPLPGLEAHRHMAPRLRSGSEPALDAASLRPAAALMLIYPHEGVWHVPLTIRGAGLRHHTGQVSLPGGRVEDGESIEAAAVREAQEEIGVPSTGIDVLGRLTPLPVFVSGYFLHPVVAVASSRPPFSVDAREVDQLIEVPVPEFLRPNAVQWDARERTRPPYGLMDVPYFDVRGARVWGATAMVLAEFLALLRHVDTHT